MQNSSTYSFIGFFGVFAVIAILVLGIQSMPDSELQPLATAFALAPETLRIIWTVAAVVTGLFIPPALMFADARDGRQRMVTIGLLTAIAFCVVTIIYCGTSLVKDAIDGQHITGAIAPANEA